MRSAGKRKQKSGNVGRVQSPPEETGKITAIPHDYRELLDELKQKVRTVQIRASLSANRELIGLYWYMGRRITEKQENAGWGASVIERISRDLQKTFPDIKGFSPRNIWRMKSFYLAYASLHTPAKDKIAGQSSGMIILPQLVAEIPWGHNVILLEKIKNSAEREWYMRQTIEHGWARVVLVHQIESGAFARQGKALTNSDRTLIPAQSDLVKQVLKDPYIFDFLSIGDAAVERDLEKALLSHIQEFLLELGVGFAFVGRQYHLSVGNEDFYVDLLFYHLRLRCYVVIELKTVDFKPEFAGKMNFYLSAVDEMLRHPEDRNSIGIILCKTANKTVVEYALRDNKKPIGISGYQLHKLLPAELKGSLPSVTDIEAELEEIGKPAK